MVRVLFSTLLLLPLLAGCASTPEEEQLDYNPKAAEANAELGKSYLLRGNYEVALVKLKRAIRFDPKSANAHHYLAELYRRLDRPEEAGTHYKLAVRHSFNDSALYNNYGVYLCGVQRVDEALVQFDKVLQNPVYRFPASIHENIGLCMIQNGQMKNAEKSLRKALSINPNLPNALFELAKLMHHNARYFSARAFINRYLESAKPSAEGLWLAIDIETKLNDHRAVNKYGEELLKRFPLSKEAEKYHRLNKR